jgi:hypothetical protein
MLAFKVFRFVNRWWQPRLRFAVVYSPALVTLRVSPEARPAVTPTHDRTVYAQL